MRSLCTTGLIPTLHSLAALFELLQPSFAPRWWLLLMGGVDAPPEPLVPPPHHTVVMGCKGDTCVNPLPGRRPHYNGLRCSLAPSSHHHHPRAQGCAPRFEPTRLPASPARPVVLYGSGVARTAKINHIPPRTARTSPLRPRIPPPLQHPLAHARPSPPRATHATAREPLPSPPPCPGSSSFFL